MTDETPAVTENVEVDPIAKLRDEMSEQFQTLKASFETAVQERDEIITKLQEENDSLHRALVRSAMTEPAPAPKSEKQIYDETVRKLADKTLRYMSMW